MVLGMERHIESKNYNDECDLINMVEVQIR